MKPRATAICGVLMLMAATVSHADGTIVTFEAVTAWEQFKESGSSAVTARVSGIGVSREHDFGPSFSTGGRVVFGLHRGDLGDLALWTDDSGKRVYLEVGLPMRATFGNGGIILQPMIVRGPYVRRDDYRIGDYRYETAFAPAVRFGGFVYLPRGFTMSLTARYVLAQDRVKLIPGFGVALGRRFYEPPANK